ncbi:MAG: MoaD/ThiS family protein [Planctomycetota bacterium]
MQIDILLFGPQAKLAKTNRITIELDHAPTVADAMSMLGEQLPELVPTLGVSRLAINHEYAQADDELSEGDEIALIGMVSGG